MINGMNDTAAADLTTDSEPAAWLRIAIPSFKFGWAKSADHNTIPDGPTIEEWQSLFRDDFRPTAKASVTLTDEELRDYKQLLNLRAALYGPLPH